MGLIHHIPHKTQMAHLEYVLTLAIYTKQLPESTTKPLHLKKYHTNWQALQHSQKWTLKWILEHSIRHTILPHNFQHPQRKIQIFKDALWTQDVPGCFPDEDGQYYRKVSRHHFHTQ